MFFQLYKNKKIHDDDGEIPDGHISFKNYLTCKRIWDKFDIKDIGDYDGHYIKKRCFVIS